MFLSNYHRVTTKPDHMCNHKKSSKCLSVIIGMVYTQGTELQKDTTEGKQLPCHWMVSFLLSFLWGEAPLKMVSSNKAILQHSNKDLGLKKKNAKSFSWDRRRTGLFSCSLLGNLPGGLLPPPITGILAWHCTPTLKGCRATGSRQQWESHQPNQRKVYTKDTGRWRWPRW